MYNIRKKIDASLVILCFLLFYHIFADNKMEMNQPNASVMELMEMDEESLVLLKSLRSSDEDTRNKTLVVLYGMLKSNDSTIRERAFGVMFSDSHYRSSLKKEPDEYFKKCVIEAILNGKLYRNKDLTFNALVYFKLTKEEINRLLAASDQYKSRDYPRFGDCWGENKMLLYGIAIGGGVDAYEPFIRHFNIDEKSTDSLNRYERYFLLMNEEGAIRRLLEKMQSKEKRIGIDPGNVTIVERLIISRIKENPDKTNIEFGIKYINFLKNIIEDENSMSYVVSSTLLSLSCMGKLNKEFKSYAKPILLNNADKLSDPFMKFQLENNLKEMEKIE